MNCEEVRASIEVLHDGEAGPHVAEQIEAHVLTCAPCRAVSEHLSALSAMLRRSTVPAPSTELDGRLAHAFRRRHSRTAAAVPAWWRRLCDGSVSIPKPAFAAAVGAVIAALAGAAMIGRITARPDSGVTRPPVSQPAHRAPAQPEVVVQTKVVEVPVVREKVVARTVYVERARRRAQGRRDVSPGSHPADSDLALHDSVGANGYVTLANLKGFEPAGEMKARVIRNGARDEK